MTNAAHRPMPLAEFLTWEDGTDTRYELIDGVPVARPIAFAAPGCLHATLAGMLHRRMRAPSSVLMSIGVVADALTDTFFMADLAVTNAMPEPSRQWIDSPVFIAEILSPSTQNHDRGIKLDAYRQIASVREILFVSSERRRVERWRRDGERWIVEDFIGSASLALEVVAEPLGLDELYDGTGI